MVSTSILNLLKFAESFENVVDQNPTEDLGISSVCNTCNNPVESDIKAEAALQEAFYLIKGIYE